GDRCTKSSVCPQHLLGDSAYGLLGSVHQLVQFGVRAHIELPETLEELTEVSDGTVPEYLALSVRLRRQAFGQMGDQFAELAHERLLGQSHRLLEAPPEPLLLLPVD